MKYNGNNISEYSIKHKNKVVGKMTLIYKLAINKILVILIHTPLDKEPSVENSEMHYSVHEMTSDIDGLLQSPLLEVYGRAEIFNFDTIKLS